MRETRAPGFDAPPSLALEEEFAASEADYSQAPPPPGDAASAREATANLARTSAHEPGIEPAPVAPAQEHDVEEPAPVTGAAPTLGSSATAEANTIAEPATPEKDEPPRPRRSGWWQRARASVIGE
jgi:ribonuclease E